jgi:colanic acid/amylovoran biosynthesis protein
MKKIVLFIDMSLKIAVVVFFAFVLRFQKFLLGSDAAAKRVIIVAPPGGGNIGDEALVQATLQKFADFHCEIYVNSYGSYQKETLSNGVVYEDPKLIYGNAVGLLKTLIARREHFARASHLVIIGADIIDGAYNERASFTRIWVAILGRLLGCNTRILGFSLNANPRMSCRLSLIAAQNIGVALFLRDPISHSRALALGLKKAIACADVVFGDDRKDVYPLPQNIKDNRFVIVNVSGLIFKENHSINDLVRIVDHIVHHGLKIILLPHVSRPGADDVAVCDKLFRSVPQHHENIVYIRQLLSPKQIRYLCSHSVLIVSGRMHLGVMALSQKKCAFIFSSQGKVEGLLKMFGFSDFEIDSSTSYSERVKALMDDVLDGKYYVADATIKNVVELSEKNFIDLTPSSVVKAAV